MSRTAPRAATPHPRVPVDTPAPHALRAGPALPPAATVLVEALVAGEDAERDALADQLHDTLAQQLTAARLAAGLVSGDTQPMLLEALGLASAQLRDLIWWLRPRGARGLGAALSELAERPHPAVAGRPALVLEPTPEGFRRACPDDVAPPVATAVVRLVQACTLAGGPAVVDVLDEPSGTGLRVRPSPDAPPPSEHLSEAVSRAVLRAGTAGLVIAHIDAPTPRTFLGGLLLRLPRAAGPRGTGEDLQ